MEKRGTEKQTAQRKFGVVSAKAQVTQTKPAEKSVDSSQCACAHDDDGGHEAGHGQDGDRGATGEDFTFSAQTEDTSWSARQRQIQEKELVVDTGAPSHILNDRSRFKNFDNTFKPERHSMEMADGKRTYGLAQGRGDARVCLIDSEGRRCAVTLKNALYIPSFPQELFSVKCASASGAKVVFEEGKDVLVVPDDARFSILVCKRMYYLQTECDESDVCNVSHDIQTWHEIMGHCNYEDIEITGCDSRHAH